MTLLQQDSASPYPPDAGWFLRVRCSFRSVYVPSPTLLWLRGDTGSGGRPSRRRGAANAKRPAVRDHQLAAMLSELAQAEEGLRQARREEERPAALDKRALHFGLGFRAAGGPFAIPLVVLAEAAEALAGAWPCRFSVRAQGLCVAVAALRLPDPCGTGFSCSGGAQSGPPTAVRVSGLSRSAPGVGSRRGSGLR